MLARYNSTISKTNLMKNVKQTHTSEKGFTVVELMIAVAIMGVMVAIAAPSVGQQIANARLKTAAKSLGSTLKEAKAESLIRRKNVTMEYTAAVAGTSAGTLTLFTDSVNTPIAQYSLNDRNTISSDSTANIVFRPSKTITSTNAISYTVCDAAISGEGIVVKVDKMSNISMTRGEVCP